MPADSEFCFELHKAAMGDYITAIWGWDEQVQREYHTRGFDPDRQISHGYNRQMPRDRA
jgi:hypothetical protein